MKLSSVNTRTCLCSLCTFFAIALSWVMGYGAQSIEGFRDLKFGMTEEQVSALPACRSSAECLYELTDKNRYVELTYLPEKIPDSADSAGTPIPRLAKITIDMGQYTEDWYQQLQIILGDSYLLTHDLTDTTLKSFLDQQQEELNAGYENGQVLLKVVRRPFGNMTLKVIYQNAALAEKFIQHMQTKTSIHQ